MKLSRILLSLAVLFALVIPMPAAAKPRADANIAEIAIGAGSFNTLVAALACTDLVGAVSGRQQLTVFAPTDAAFADLGLNAGNVCTAFKTDALSNILLYHVTRGNRLSQSVLGKNQILMLNGGRISVSRTGQINGNSNIVDANIRASNGVIHVIDKVLLP
jgi:uncharacterized surface protein with fasciclin (FAS1) repeats